MKDNYSSTGVNNLKPGEMKQSLLFFDNTCPVCGNTLILDSKLLKNEIINIRYICNYCKFVCPIQHDDSDPTQLRPNYDSSISDFIDNLGENINDTRVRMLNIK